MSASYKQLSQELAKKAIRPSFQRIKVLEYLLANQQHPTVDQIYQDLKSQIPTLSKTTIYATLNLFADTGLVRALNIEGNEIRYDIITYTHGHFKCISCNSISNFEIKIDSYVNDDLSGFEITDRSVYFKGTCPKCLLNINADLRKEHLS